MKRALILLALAPALVVAGVAQADPANPCNAPTGAVKSVYSDVFASGQGYDCAPRPLGAGTYPTLHSNAAGVVAWWYCPRPDGRWNLNWAAATHDSLDAGALLKEIFTALSATDPGAAFDAVSARHVRLPLSDPRLTPVWCPFAEEMRTNAPAPSTAAAAAGVPSPPTEHASSGR